MCVCSLRYPACNAHAHHMWPVRFSKIFQNYVVNGTIFEGGKKLLNRKCVFWLSLQFCLKHCKNNWARFDKKMYIGLHVKYPLFFSDLKETWIFSTNFVWDISHSKNNWARFDKKMYIGLHVKYPLFLSGFNETWIFSTNFVWDISHSKNNWARFDKKMYIGLRVKYPLFLSSFNKILIVSTDFSRSPQIPNFMNIRPVRAELFHVDRETHGQTNRQTCRI